MNRKFRESPDFIKLSLAGALTLGIKNGRFWRDAHMTCINLLLHYEDGCKANCGYCGLSRERIADEQTFIHVPWPLRPTDEVIRRINKSPIPRRTCISMIVHHRAREDTLSLTRKLFSETGLPVSILLSPTITDEDYLKDLKKAGADKIGIAVDASTPDLFDKWRGKGVKGPHRWDDYWKRFEESVTVFGSENVGSHFIRGLGEREKDLVHCFQRVHDMGSENHLFSFFPEEGSAMAKTSLPPLDSYRRIQVACHLIDEGVASFHDFVFDEDSGNIVSFGVDQDTLDSVIDSGEPFRTRGCRNCEGEVDCNRPYGNSFPGENLRNYPFKPSKKDIALIRKQILCPDEKRTIIFSAPTLKNYHNDYFSNRNTNAFPAFSVTGEQCSLMCDHCRAGLLKPMIPALTPGDLLKKATELSREGARGALVSGGCNENGIVPLVPFAPVIKRVKYELGMITTIHSKFVDRTLAEALAETGVDSVMIDLAPERVIHSVYHLKDKSHSDIEKSLDLLEEFNLPAAPHIIFGFNGNGSTRNMDEYYNLIKMLKGRSLQSVVAVFHMPLSGTPLSKAEDISISETGRLFEALRESVSETPIFLGCARPPGPIQVKIETRALRHGFNGIAFPSEEIIRLSKKRGMNVRFEPLCCAISVLK